MKRFYSIIIILFLTALISGFLFGSVSQSGKTGDNFYNYLQAKDYNAIIDILDKGALENMSEKEWLLILKSRNFLLGNSFNYTNTGFHTSTVDNISITKLSYTIENEDKVIYESIDLIKRDDGYKIINYHFKEKTDKNFAMK